MGRRHRISRQDFDGVLFDLDGVITSTHHAHFRAWKALFDDFLERRQVETGEPFREFTETDMLRHVDGRPRYEGVETFLASRGIGLPFGDPSDPEDADTVCGLGNRKNRLFNEVVAEEGVEVFESSVRLVRDARSAGLKCAVVSSSRNCGTVLRAGGIEDLFDLRFDGNDGARLGVKGKPEPDTFLTAAQWLGIEPARGVVVEDAVSGVRAGRAGGFGLVIGVDRDGNADALRANGADLVVGDLGEIAVEKRGGKR